MKQCSLDNFMDSLGPWLDSNYIRSVSIDLKGHVTFFFMDGVRDTYEITDCDRAQVLEACKDLTKRGIPVKEG